MIRHEGVRQAPETVCVSAPGNDAACPSDLISGSVRSMIGPLRFASQPAKQLSFEPMLCDKAEQPPEGLEWRYELKREIKAKSRRSKRLAGHRITSP